MNWGIGSGRENADPASVSRGWRLWSGTTADGGTTPHLSQHAIGSSIHASNNISRDHSTHTHINNPTNHYSLTLYCYSDVTKLHVHHSQYSLTVSTTQPIISAYSGTTHTKAQFYQLGITSVREQRISRDLFSGKVLAFYQHFLTSE